MSQTALTQLYKSGGLTALPDAIHLTQQERLPSGNEGHAIQTSGMRQLQLVNDPVKASEGPDSSADGFGKDDLSAFLSGKCLLTVLDKHADELCLQQACFAFFDGLKLLNHKEAGL